MLAGSCLTHRAFMYCSWCLLMGAFDVHLSFNQFWGKVQGRSDSRHGHVIILIEDSRNTQVTKLHLVIVPEKHINLVR